MRLLFLILLLVNVAACSYIFYAERRAGADAQIMLLQISPDKLKLLKPTAPPPAQRNDKPAAATQQSGLVCLEWGSFGAEDIARAEAALAKFDLGDKLSQRASGDRGWWVYIPPLKTKAEADKKAAEAKALGVGDLTVVQDNNAYRFAISLGVFKTEEAAANYLAQLRQKGVRSATAGPRGVRSSTFVIRDPGNTVVASLAELKVDFPSASLKATTCADAQQAAKS